jgi:hypothetical protein
MKKLMSIIVLTVLATTAAIAQKAKVNTAINATCQCKNLKTFPYFYKENPSSPTSNYILRFDFQHKGAQNCTPKLKGNLVVKGTAGQTISIPVGRLATRISNNTTLQYLISPDQIPYPLAVSASYKFTYNFEYGTVSPCPIKTIALTLEDSEPIL